MKCEQWQDRIWDYLENELPKEERIAVEAHLKECSECTAFMEETKEVLFGLHNLPQVELPQDFHSRLMDTLAQERMERMETMETMETNVVPFPVKKNTQNRWKRLSLVAAAALVVVAVGSSQGVFDFRQKQEDLVQMVAEQGTELQAKGDAGIPAEATGVAPQSVPEATEDVQGKQTEQAEVAQPKEEAKQVETEKVEAKKVEAKKVEAKKVEAKKDGNVVATPKATKAEPAPALMASPQAAQGAVPENQPMAMQATAADAPMADQGENRTMFRSAPTPIETPDDMVILTVPSAEGVFGEIRDLAVTYAGYELETDKADAVTVSIPREQVKGFYEALEKLGKVRLLEESHPVKDAEIIEISLEVKA